MASEASKKIEKLDGYLPLIEMILVVTLGCLRKAFSKGNLHFFGGGEVARSPTKKHLCKFTFIHPFRLAIAIENHCWLCQKTMTTSSVLSEIEVPVVKSA